MSDEKDFNPDRLYHIDSKGVEHSLVKHIFNGMEKDDLLHFVMHQLQMAVMNHYKSAEDFLNDCRESKHAIMVHLPQPAINLILGLANCQNKMSPGRLMSAAIAVFLSLGIERFHEEIGTSDKFMRMHQDVAQKIGGIIDPNFQGKED